MKDIPAVTGMGAVTPLGVGVSAGWRALVRGDSAVCRGSHGYLEARPPDGFRGGDRAYEMLLAAVAEALGAAKLPPEKKVCFVLSQSKPGAGIFKDFFPNVMGALGARVAANFEFTSKTVKSAVAACAGGIQSIFCAMAAIAGGQYDAAVVGAAEASIEPLYVGAFGNMGVLARGRVRPFDELREGFALGEGASAIVIEPKMSAVARGADVIAEISGISVMSSSDILNIGRDSGTVTRAIRAAAGEYMGRIDYINAHGTATRQNDTAEARAIADAFGEGARRIAISSTKAATGHMLGAGGVAEFIFSIMAMIESMAPSTLNLETPIAELDFVAGAAARPSRIRRAMSLSYGFGSQIGAVVCAKPDL